MRWRSSVSCRDIGLPAAGLVARHFRADERLRSIPLVALTGYAMAEISGVHCRPGSTGTGGTASNAARCSTSCAGWLKRPRATLKLRRKRSPSRLPRLPAPPECGKQQRRHARDVCRQCRRRRACRKARSRHARPAAREPSRKTGDVSRRASASFTAKRPKSRQRSAFTRAAVPSPVVAAGAKPSWRLLLRSWGRRSGPPIRVPSAAGSVRSAHPGHRAEKQRPPAKCRAASTAATTGHGTLSTASAIATASTQPARIAAIPSSTSTSMVSQVSAASREFGRCQFEGVTNAVRGADQRRAPMPRQPHPARRPPTGGRRLGPIRRRAGGVSAHRRLSMEVTMTPAAKASAAAVKGFRSM